MTHWIFEPGHSAAEFAVRHMMVLHMRGLFKNVHGRIDFDPDNPADAAEIEAHLRGTDFLKVEKYPDIAFRSAEVSCVGGADSGSRAISPSAA